MIICGLRRTGKETIMGKKIYAFANAGKETGASLEEMAVMYENNGADGIYIFNRTADEKEFDDFLLTVKKIVRLVDMPVMIGIDAKRFEDIKKAFYTGAAKVVIRYGKLEDKSVADEAVKRFGADRIALEVDARKEDGDGLFDGGAFDTLGAGSVLLKHVTLGESFDAVASKIGVPVVIRDDLVRNSAEDLLGAACCEGIVTNAYYDSSVYEIKSDLKAKGADVAVPESPVAFDRLKTVNGLVPVIVQDYKNDEVLMLAYMNAESFEKTIRTGKMTYFSRSRNCLWVKGETSGHFQYLKSLELDCDSDTLLAKVKQIGAACHTGNRSCFYTNLIKKDYESRNPYRILEGLYEVIEDRKKNPKEGSYTNYLFDKGIDKIHKKCGEEATEIVIAARNPGAEELKYEIADFLYHLSVLMVETGVDWSDIATELANRS